MTLFSYVYKNSLSEKEKCMFLVFFLIWIIFNGQVNLEITMFGLIISGLMYWFICKFMNYDPKMEKVIFKKSIKMIHYFIILVKEIIKANGEVIRLANSVKYELEPVVVTFKVDLNSYLLRVLLANSITLTPGTITISLKGNEYVVHCLDKSLATGMDKSIFVKLLKEMDN